VDSAHTLTVTHTHTICLPTPNSFPKTPVLTTPLPTTPLPDARWKSSHLQTQSASHAWATHKLRTPFNFPDTTSGFQPPSLKQFGQMSNAPMPDGSQATCRPKSQVTHGPRTSCAPPFNFPDTTSGFQLPSLKGQNPNRTKPECQWHVEVPNPDGSQVTSRPKPQVTHKPRTSCARPFGFPEWTRHSQPLVCRFRCPSQNPNLAQRQNPTSDSQTPVPDAVMPGVRWKSTPPDPNQATHEPRTSCAPTPASPKTPHKPSDPKRSQTANSNISHFLFPLLKPKAQVMPNDAEGQVTPRPNSRCASHA